MLKVLINRKKVFYLEEDVLGNVFIVLNAAETGVSGRIGQNLLIRNPLVQHFEQTDGPCGEHTAWKGWGISQNKDVEGIAVLGEGLGDEAVVARIVDRRMKIAIQSEHVERLVIFVFVDTVEGDFNDSSDDVWRLIANWKIKIIHSFAHFRMSGVGANKKTPTPS
jgi:hypothetical protein